MPCFRGQVGPGWAGADYVGRESMLSRPATPRQARHGKGGRESMAPGNLTFPNPRTHPPIAESYFFHDAA